METTQYIKGDDDPEGTDLPEVELGGYWPEPGQAAIREAMGRLGLSNEAMEDVDDALASPDGNLPTGVYPNWDRVIQLAMKLREAGEA
jgi:hypothetical protein